MPVSDVTHLRFSRFLIGDWTVDADGNRISREGRVERLEPKSMEVLLELAVRAGETVRREKLLESVWEDVYVTEGTLSRCISQLRKALDDNPQEPVYIETIPRMGYRLIAPVRLSGGGDHYEAPRKTPVLSV